MVQKQDHLQGKAKVLIVDDHPVVRQALAQLIEPQIDLMPCGNAGNASEALEAIATLNPDVVVVDISLSPGPNGLELTKDIKLRFPQLPVLVLSLHDEIVFAQRALRAGARGYVMKQEAMETVLTAIRQVLNGQIYLSRNMASKMSARIVVEGDDADELNT